MRYFRFATLVTFLFLGISGTSFADGRTSHAPIFLWDTQDLLPDPYGSTLTRRGKSVSFNFYSAEMEPATPHTLWVVAFNYPQYCLDPDNCGFQDLPTDPRHDPRVQVSFINGTGAYTKTDGTQLFLGKTYSPFRGINGSEVTVGPGLINPLGAEIHLVIRTHGEVSTFEDMLAAIKTYRGGCTETNLCRDYQSSIHKPRKHRN